MFYILYVHNWPFIQYWIFILLTHPTKTYWTCVITTMLRCSTEQKTQYLQVWKLETGSSAVCEYNWILLWVPSLSLKAKFKWSRNLSSVLASHHTFRYPTSYHFAWFIQFSVLPCAAIKELYCCSNKSLYLLKFSSTPSMGAASLVAKW